MLIFYSHHRRSLPYIQALAHQITAQITEISVRAAHPDGGDWRKERCHLDSWKEKANITWFRLIPVDWFYREVGLEHLRS